jgi:hypothetical protein
VNGNGKIIDPNADAAVRQAMMASQQQMQLAIMQIELRDRFAIAVMQANAAQASTTGRPCSVHADDLHQAYRTADLMLKVRQEKPADAPLAPTSED